MRIVALILPNAPAYHRLVVPLSLMEGVEYIPLMMHLDEPMPTWADDSVFDKHTDLVIYNRVLEPLVMAWVYMHQKKHSFKICVDIDDHWILGKDHPLYREENEDYLIRSQIVHLQHADIVLTTHERLAAEIRPINPNVHICPNAITRKVDQFDIGTTESAKVRLFWQGTRTHRHDVEILNHPMSQLRDIYNIAQPFISGVECVKSIDDEDDHESKEEELQPIWVEMIKSFCGYSENSPTAFSFVRNHGYTLGRPVDKYYLAYQYADICLVPLMHNKFNRFKSNLKVLEAANMGLPVVASFVHPYLSMPISYCMRSSDWVEQIRRLVRSPAAREDEGGRLKAWAEDHFSFDKINEERRQILEYSIKTISA